MAEEVLSLPAPSDKANDLRTITVGGPALKLDILGPVVVNTDGTLERITNWHEMTEEEQSRTFKLIGQRNVIRIQALQKAGEVGDELCSFLQQESPVTSEMDDLFADLD
jgi:hypothetical protein